MIFLNVLALSFFLIFIDHQTGYYMWSINYAVPLLIVLGTTIITLVILIKPLYIRDFIVYQLTTAMLGIAAVLLLVFDVPSVKWPISVSALYCGLIWLGMFLFRDRRTIHELKKRFHI